MIFAILDNNIYTLSNTHRMHVEKLSIGFIQIGYRVITIRDLNCIKSLGSEDILYVSNHFSVYSIHKLFLRYTSEKLYNALITTKAKIILWHPHTIGQKRFYDLQNASCLGENFKVDDLDEKHPERIRQSKKKYFPIRYCSPQDRELVKRKPINERNYKLFYTGNKYNKSISDALKKRFPDSFIRVYPPFVSETVRVKSLENSIISLGFFSSTHIKFASFTERLSEALACGCIILHNHYNLPKDISNLESVIYVEGDITNYIKKIENLFFSGGEYLQKLSNISYDYYCSSNLSYKDFAFDLLDHINKNS